MEIGGYGVCCMYYAISTVDGSASVACVIRCSFTGDQPTDTILIKPLDLNVG